MSAFPTAFLLFLKPLFELSHLFHQISHLSGLSTSWFLPGLLCGVKGLSQPVLLAAVLVEPTTLRGVVGRERFANSLAPFAKLVGTVLLGGPLFRPSPCVRFPFLGTCSPANLAVAATLALLARAASFAFSANSFSIFTKSTRMALGDSGTNVCVSAY
jgi:hypothetical protein